MQDKLPKNILTKVAFTGLDLYLSSENLNVGADRASNARAEAVDYFKTTTKKMINNETLFLISMHKF